MEGILLATQGAIVQGILWGIMVLGVYITFRVLDFADMTVDGSFALGGAVCATMITKGINPFLQTRFSGHQMTCHDQDDCDSLGLNKDRIALCRGCHFSI